jgi:ABC-type transporter Mla MlaB component
MPDIDPAGHVLLEGSLTMRTVEAVCETLREALARHQVVRLDCGGAEEVDLAVLQVLVAARRSALDSNKIITFIKTPDGALLNALHRAGFDVIPDQSAGAGQGYWFEGAAA